MSTVLIVDDDPQTLDVLRIACTARGYHAARVLPQESPVLPAGGQRPRLANAHFGE